MSPLRTGWNSFSNFFIFAIISILKFKICFLVLGNPLTELHIFKILLCNTPSTFSPNCFSKGTVQRDFRTPCFFHHSNLPGPLTNTLKLFRFWLRFCWVIQIFITLPGVRYLGKTISTGYHTPASHLTLLDPN